MAMTAAVTLSSATAVAGGNEVAVTITVSNSASVAVAVKSIRPIAYASGTTQEFPSVNMDRVDVNPSNNSVGASGSAAYQYGAQFFGPQAAGVAGGEYGPATLAVDMTAEVCCADGTILYPTVATVTVSPSPHN